MPGIYNVPFDRKGNQLHYASYASRSITWRPNYAFDASLRVVGMASGHSAKYLLLESEPGATRYTMFVVDLVDALHKSTVYEGLLVGRFTFIKRGQNFGVKLLEEAQWPYPSS